MNSRKKKKTGFDCVEMMHRGGQAIRKKIAGMSPKEEAEFWRKNSRKLAAKQQMARTRKTISQ